MSILMPVPHSLNYCSTHTHTHTHMYMYAHIHKNFYLFIYFWLCWLFLLCVPFSSCGKCGLLLIAVHELLIVEASLVVEHGPQSTGSVAVALKLCCFTACGIFPDQGSKPCFSYTGREILYH